MLAQSKNRTEQAPVANQPSSWVQDLIDKRYQPKTERLKRTPVGFDFKRDPFDPSSYYNALGKYKNIASLATDVTMQEVQNKKNAEMQAAYEASQKAMQDALNGVSANFTGGVATSGAKGNYRLKGVSANTGNAANYFGGKYGIRTVYGKGPGSVPGSDHPKGRAIDLMINNIKNGKNVGTAMANDIIKNAKAWNVKYVIWNRYIWHPGIGWRKYNGPSPHTDHVHVSFNN